MSTLPVLALSLLTLAGAPKQGPKGGAGGQPTCEDQCKMIEAACTDSCKQVPAGGQGQNMCRKTCSDIARTCGGSCREKGHIDEEYMKQHMQLPAGAKPGDLNREVDDGDHE